MLRPLICIFCSLAAFLCVKAAEPLRKAPVGTPAAGKGSLDEFLAKVEPQSDRDAWSEEAFAEEASGALKKLAAACEHAGRPDEAACAALTTADFNCGSLRPEEAARIEVFRDAALVVRRGLPQGRAGGLAAAIRQFTSLWPAGGEVHVKFKITGVTMPPGGTTGETKVLLQADGATPAGIAQISATWTCSWLRKAPDAKPVLTKIVVTDYEEVTPGGDKHAPLFVEVTGAVMGSTESWRSVLTRSLDYWFGTVDAAFQVPLGTHGVSLADVDGDGREDVFLSQPAGLRNVLLRRKSDGTLEDFAQQAGVDFLDNSRASLFADFDNDGDADLVLNLGYGVIIMENDGKGHFTRRTRADMASWPMSMSAADCDLDGDVDIYITGYTSRDSVSGGDALANPVPYHDANNGARNFLLRNDGGWKFTDATAVAGLDANNRKFSLAATWEDFDNDGDPDIYVANDFGRKNLYRNDLIKNGVRQPAPYFTDIAASAGVEDIGAGMSAAWGDSDHDGLMDLYVSNMFSSAGRRIAWQQQFQEGESPESLAGYRRHARGNSLFRNRGNGTFTDVAEESATEVGRWAWGSLFTDLNNDSWEDLYVCNGFYTRPDPGDL